jgi:hypothetical protein
VKLIAGKLGTSPQNNARLYLVCSGVLKSLVTANLGVGNPKAMDDWCFSVSMENIVIPKPNIILKQQTFGGLIQTMVAGISGGTTGSYKHMNLNKIAGKYVRLTV